MTTDPNPTTADDYAATVCIRCDPVRPENVGGTVSECCPKCGAWMFGLQAGGTKRFNSVEELMKDLQSDD